MNHRIGSWLKPISPMKEIYRKKLLILISNRFACTNVIHSKLLGELAKNYDISILSDIITNADVKEMEQHYSIRIQKLDQQLLPEGSWCRFLRKIQKWLFFYHFNIRSFQIKQMRMNRLQVHLMNGLIHILRVFNLNLYLLIQLRKYLIFLSKQYSYSSSLSQFDGVISTSPLDYRENVIINQLPPHVRTMGMVISWDNLTTKGLINADHHLVLVWNRYMMQDYNRIYSNLNLSCHHVEITGIPRFDIYFKSLDKAKSRLAFNEEFKYGRQDQILLFATSAHKHFPTQAHILTDLQSYCIHKKNLKILVRCHPSDDIRHYKSQLLQINTQLWAPLNETGSGLQMPHLDHLDSLVRMIQNCAVCIQVASTIRLDAMACGKPTISIAYDGIIPKEYADSVRRYYDYDHQIPLNELQMDHIVYSKEAFFHALDQILEAKTTSKSLFPRTPSAFTHFTKPNAVKTALQHIDSWLN
jgi:hypothetical protein